MTRTSQIPYCHVSQSKVLFKRYRVHLQFKQMFFDFIRAIAVLGVLIFLGFGCAQQDTGTGLISVRIEPDHFSITKGSVRRIKAVGVYKDGKISDISDSVIWSTSDITVSNIMKIGQNINNKWQVKGIKEGSVIIFATISEGISGTASLTITPSKLESLSIIPSNLFVHLGHVQQFTAIGTYSDGLKKDLTNRVNWSSSDASLPIISNTPGSKGLGISPPAGKITIMAVDPQTNIKGSTVITVTSTKLVAVTVDPVDKKMPLGSGQAFTATGTYVDGTTNDISTSVIWTVSVPSVAIVSNKADTKGVVKTLSVGETNIKATDPTVIISGSAGLTVTPPELNSIIINPSAASVFLGSVQSLSATGVYSDGTEMEITEFLIWTSSDASVVLVRDAEDSAIAANSVSIGATTIKATEPKTGITAVTQMTVKLPELVSIIIRPVAPNIYIGNKQPFKAIGIFSDGKKKNITAGVHWTSSKPAVAIISNARKYKGLAVSKRVGVATISAVFKNTGVKTETILKISEPKLVSITITPDSATIFSGDRQLFKAIGTFSNGKKKDLTKGVRWSSSQPSIVKISNTGKNKGLARSESTGAAVISAKAPELGVTGKASVSIAPAKLASVLIFPSNPSVIQGEVQSFSAKGIYSDGTSKDITRSIVWTSSNPSVADIIDSSDSGIVLMSVSAGTTEIKAASPHLNISKTTQMTVTQSKLVSIIISPSNPLLPLSRIQSFTATGIYSDGKQKNVTDHVHWVSLNPLIARISNSSRKKGHATSLSFGSTVISATDPDTGIRGETLLKAKTF